MVSREPCYKQSAFPFNRAYALAMKTDPHGYTISDLGLACVKPVQTTDRKSHVCMYHHRPAFRLSCICLPCSDLLTYLT